jgi:hypothetical protein
VRVASAGLALPACTRGLRRDEVNNTSIILETGDPCAASANAPQSTPNFPCAANDVPQGKVTVVPHGRVKYPTSRIFFRYAGGGLLRRCLPSLAPGAACELQIARGPDARDDPEKFL